MTNSDKLEELVPKMYKHTTLNNLTENEKLYSGKEWYERFEREYHLRADWIRGDPEMGDDAENDVLSAAKKASGL